MKKYAVITYSGVHYLLTEAQNDILRLASADDEIDIDGNLLKVKNISDILTIEKYRETYPDKNTYRRSDDEVDVIKELGSGYKGIIDSSSIKGIQEMMKGFLKYGSKDNELYKHMEFKLKQKQNASAGTL